jgi:hypothetical protein
MAGQFAVSPSGAATYSIPIQVPPGAGGMQPQLALSYNSQAGNGLLGVGWNLSGLSAIARCARTMAQDGVRGGVDYDGNDRFCLDGQRLILIGGLYGAPGSQYRTEAESFARITYDGAAFKIQSKAGLTSEYGNTADSRIEAQGKSVVRVWAMNKMTDAAGNYLRVAYQEDNANGDFRVDRIDYAGNDNTGQGTTNAVIFGYEGRLDAVPMYQAGSVVKMMQRLSTVSTYAAGNLTNSYYLKYGAPSIPTDKTRLFSIRQCSTSDGCLPDLIFSYPSYKNGDGVSKIFETSLCANGDAVNGVCNDSDNHRYIRYADINGDGLPDMCIRADAGIRCIINKGGTALWDQSQVIATNICANGSGSYGVCNDSDNWDYISYLDINGDGMADLVYRSDNGMRAWLSTGTSFVDTWSSSLCANGDTANGICNDSDNHRYIRYADINGDGLPDMCIRADAGIRCIINKGSTALWDQTQVITTNICANGSGSYGVCNDSDNWDYISYVDINGDGMADLVYRSDTGMRAWLSTGASFVDTWSSSLCANGDTANGVCNDSDNHRYIRYTDINGDGLPDMCIRADAGIKCIINKGGAALWDQTQVITTNICANGSGSYGVCNDSDNWDYISYVDVNGDGMADLVYRSDNGMRAWLSTGTSFVDTWSTSLCANGDGANGVCNDADNHSTIQFVDADGNGGLNICYRSDSGMRCIGDFFNGKYGTYAPIVSITGGDRGVTMDYGHASTLGNINDVIPGLRVYLPQSGWTLLTSSTNNYAGGLSSMGYGYGPLMVELGTGRGSLGFRWVKSRENSTGIESYTEYRQDWPYTGLPSLSETRLAGAGAGGVLKRTQVNYACKTGSGADCQPVPANCNVPSNVATCTGISFERVFPYASSVTEQSWDLNGTVMPVSTTNNLYDKSINDALYWGDASQVVVTTSSGASSSTKQVQNEYYPANTSSGKWIAGRLKRARVISTVTAP